MISGTIKAGQMKLYTVIALLKTFENTKNLKTSPMTSQQRHYKENSDLCETKQIIYHSAGNDESFPKM